MFIFLLFYGGKVRGSGTPQMLRARSAERAVGGVYLLAGRLRGGCGGADHYNSNVSGCIARLSAKKRTKRRMRCCSSCVSRRRSFYPNALQCERSVLYMHRHDHKEREPKAFPQYDDAAHIDSAAVAEYPRGEQTREPKGRCQSNGLHGENFEEQHK